MILTSDSGAVRIEARGAGIDEAILDPAVGDRLAARWGIAHRHGGATLWYALGPPITGEQTLRR